MALNVYFFKFSKKHNSTARPPVDTEYATLAELKDETTIHTLQMYIMPFERSGVTVQPYGFNYCFVPEFNRYYFIEDWQWEFGRWLCTCKVDVLASFSDTILLSSQYVARSSYDSTGDYAVFNGRIVDTIYPIKTHTDVYTDQLSTVVYDPTTQTSRYLRPLTTRPNRGYYIVGIIAQGGEPASTITGTLGVVNYYLFTQAAFKKFKRALFSNATWTGIADATMNNDVLKAFFNPIEYIASCKWSPISELSRYGVSMVNAIAFGWWVFTVTPETGETDTGVYMFSDNSLLMCAFSWAVDSLFITKHPQYNRGYYLQYEPYSEYELAIAPYGVVKMPSIISEAGFSVREYIDFVTGKSTLYIFIGQNHDGNQAFVPFAKAESQLLVDVQIAQVRSTGDVQTRLANTGVGLINSWLDKLPDGFIKNAATGITGAFMDATTAVSSVGTNNGGFADLNMFGTLDMYLGSCQLHSKFAIIADEDIDHFGRPLCEQRVLGTLSGFTQCANAEIAIQGSDVETKEIETYMNTGFYIET